MQAPPRGLVMLAMAKLSRSILTVLFSGRHAALGGRSARERAANLARIAAAYSRTELEAEKGIGPARATAVEHWLEGQGSSLRAEQSCSISASVSVEMVAVGNAGSEVQ
ncbi:hypothetical protein [Bosea vaviloviae]|uniref:hypothetical protein n=1 Tax=Bosea vaviloviae TaxID=1526658 RepID=UPI0012E11A50|nr:hypothetical protein [Bosea vaviloviae]